MSAQMRAAEQEKLKPQPGQVCGDMERREKVGWLLMLFKD
jgi:hypothetical protein